MAVLLGNGTAGHGNGTFGPPASIGTGGPNLSIALSDYDRDGHLDIGITAVGPGNVDIYRGHGDGTFSPRVSYPVGGYPSALALADFDRDGLPDLACSDYGTHDVALLFGKCASLVPPPPPPCPGSPLFGPSVTYSARPASFGLAEGDFNHDGYLDLAVGGNGTSDVQVFYGHPGGTFTPGPIYPAGYLPHDVVAADLNHDGILDLVVVDGGQNANCVAVLLGNGSGGIGDGTFGPPAIFPAGNKPYDAVVRDFDGDGIPDVVTTEFDGNAVSFLKGNGDGTFFPPHSYPAGLRAYGIVAADFNSDGKLDLAVGNQDSHNVSILLGDGHGAFAPPVNYNAGGPVYSLALGDYNHDGILDIAVVDGGTKNAGVFIGGGSGGLGDGTFSPEVRYMLSGPGPAGIQAADFNHDGILDLAVTNVSTGKVDVLIGLEEAGVGDGKFSAPFSFDVDSYPFATQVGDFDHDGAPDVATANYYGNSVSVLLGGCRLVTGIKLAGLMAEPEAGAVKLSWNALMDGPSEFEVQRSGSRAGSYVRVADLSGQPAKTEYSIVDASAAPGESYFYRVAFRELGGSWSYMGPVQVRAPQSPFALTGATPNPSRGRTRIDFSMDRSGLASIEVFGASGRRLTTLLQGGVNAGRGSVEWDGKSHGIALPAGTYFVRLTSGARTMTKKLVLFP